MIKKKVIIFSIIILALAAIMPAKAQDGQEDRSYVIQIINNEGQISFGEVLTKPGAAPVAQAEPENEQYFMIELISFSGEKLEERLLKPTEELKNVPMALGPDDQLTLLPFHSNGKTLSLYDASQNLIAQKEVDYLSDVCGDGICQDHESYFYCADDCPATGKDGYCNQEKINQDPDCERLLEIIAERESITTTPTPEPAPVSIITKYWKYIIAAIILIIIIAIIIWYNNKNKPEIRNFE